MCGGLSGGEVVQAGKRQGKEQGWGERGQRSEKGKAR